MKPAIRFSVFFLLSCFLWTIGTLTPANGQGTWTPVTNSPVTPNAGVTLLLSDGTIMCKNYDGGTYGMGWDRLTPDSTGSYINGTWSDMAPMYYDRLYFGSQVLKSGKVYVSGGEYGSGFNNAEVYDPVAGSWTTVPPLTATDTFYDANTMILPDGRVLQGVINYATGFRGNYIYNPATNSFSNAPECLGMHLETTWLLLPDGSILLPDWQATTSERYIPSLGTWVADATLPISIYDDISNETGAAVMLPNGKAFFMGGNGNTVFYTPSGTASPGTWTVGPSLPLGQGAPDVPASVLPNGKVLLVTSLVPYGTTYFPSPMYFYEFDYLTNTYTSVPLPPGFDSTGVPPFFDHMLNLPDGNVLMSFFYSNQYYVYTPSGSAIAAGHPSIDSIFKVSCDTYLITGTQFNGISTGSSYGDDWQMATNYPIVRLTNGTHVYYARTYNWNRTGICTGSLPDTTTFVLPAGLPAATYSLDVSANGIASVPVSFHTCPPVQVPGIVIGRAVQLMPNPATASTNLIFQSSGEADCQLTLKNSIGQTAFQTTIQTHAGANNFVVPLHTLSAGIYLLTLQSADQLVNEKLVVE